MPTDDERREMARRLRNVEMHAIPDARIADNPMTVEFIAAAVFYDLPYVRGLFARLADLIDPDTTKAPACDRDALLALADAMEDHASDVSAGHNYVDQRDLNDYARLIREALG